MIQKSETTRRRVAFFAGSFNPFTIGHASIVERGLHVFDRVIVGVGINIAKEPRNVCPAHLKAIEDLYAGIPEVKVVSFSGLATSAAIEHGATHLLRGVRTVSDFEYERNMADLNRRISGLETLLLFSLPGLECISSSAVRELKHFGADISEFVP